MDLSFCRGDFSTILTVQEGGNQRIGLSCIGNTISARINNSAVGSWNYALPGAGRKVLTLVVDTTAAAAADRTKLYADGVLRTAASATASLNSTVDFPGANPFYLNIGNMGGNRAVVGKIGYAALYSSALTPQEVSDSAARLLLSDDSPVAPATTLAWSESSPSSTTTVTANWTKSTSPSLTNQKIRFYRDASCSIPSGAEIDLVSTSAQSQAFTGSASLAYAFQVKSIDSLGQETLSRCSGLLSLQRPPALATPAGTLARYFFDEATSGRAVATAREARSSSPVLDLNLYYEGTQMNYSSAATGSALEFTDPAGNGFQVASLPTGGGSIQTALQGSTKFSIEAVVDLTFCRGDHSTILIVQAIGSHRVGLTCVGSRIQAKMNSGTIGEWAFALPAAGRQLLTLTVDTAEFGSKRVLIYLNGRLLSSSGSSLPNLNSTVDFTYTANPFYLDIGNQGGTRAIVGKIGYAALYSSALTPQEVSDNATVLLYSDAP